MKSTLYNLIAQRLWWLISIPSHIFLCKNKFFHLNFKVFLITWYAYLSIKVFCQCLPFKGYEFTEDINVNSDDVIDEDMTILKCFFLMLSIYKSNQNVLRDLETSENLIWQIVASQVSRPRKCPWMVRVQSYITMLNRFSYTFIW